MTDSTAGDKRPDYHHGNLPAALIAAARKIIEEEGVETLSLRAAARRANVSHGAPYHHFSSKAAMLAAVATEGFQELTAAIEGEKSRYAAEDYYGHVIAVGTAYVTFAVRFPAIFRLMFRPELTLPAEHPLLQQAEAKTFGTLVQSIADCQAAGILPGTDPLPLSLGAWSTVHGFSTLWVHDVLAETPLKALPLEQVAPYLMRFIMSGLTAPLTLDSAAADSAAEPPAG